MAVGPSQPHTMPQTASTTTSTKRCFRFRVCRGSESDSKYEPMDSTFTHGVVMRGIPGVSSGASRSAIASRANTAVATVYQDEAARASPRIFPIYARWPWEGTLRVGFTGTRHGLTPQQQEALARLLAERRPTE